jgi:hypothetical protein
MHQRLFQTNVLWHFARCWCHLRSISCSHYTNYRSYFYDFISYKFKFVALSQVDIFLKVKLICIKDSVRRMSYDISLDVDVIIYFHRNDRNVTFTLWRRITQLFFLWGTFWVSNSKRRKHLKKPFFRYTEGFPNFILMNFASTSAS